METGIASRPLLTAAAVTYTRDGRDILRDVTFAVAPGELVGLIGPNGAGKSTLLRVISGLWTGAASDIRLLDRSLAHYTPREIARIIAQVPQITALDFPFTVQQVVLMGRNPHLGRFQLETARDRRIVAEAMHRTLTQEPRLLLLDEPTANLDIQHQIGILDLVRDLIREDGLGAVAAVHDLELAARFCDRLVLLHRGTVLAEGSPESVLTSDHLCTAYGVDARPYPDPVTGHLRLAVLGNGRSPT
jgi:iron complex transport system ATP-binding protein